MIMASDQSLSSAPHGLRSHFALHNPALGIREIMRSFALLLSLLGGAVAWPLTVRAQLPSDRPLIAFLAGGTQWNASRYLAALQEGLRELGYVEGQNIDLVP